MSQVVLTEGEFALYEETRKFVPLKSLRHPGIYKVEVLEHRPDEGTCLVKFVNSGHWQVVGIDRLKKLLDPE